MSTINSLGIGSGVLTSDIIDQLREADESVIIAPLESKIELGIQKEEAFELLESLMSTLKTSASALDGDNIYLGRSVSGNTDAVTVTAESGTSVQNFTITDVDRAESDVFNSSSFTTKSTAMEDLGAGTMTMTLDGKDYAFDYSSTDSLNTIRDSINDAASDVMTASVLQVGDDSYELIITAKETNQAITFADTNTTTESLESKLSLVNIQVAEPATFKYNGIEITRSSNEVTDLMLGVTINLNQNQEAGVDTASVQISQNDTSIKSEMSLFVSSYNSLITNIQDMTSSDRTSGAVGIFNGESFVKSIMRDISTITTQVDSSGNSLMDFGIDIDRYGVMTLDSGVLDEKIKADPESLEKIFSGDSTTQTDGIFTKLNDRLTEYTGYNKLLSNFSDQLSSYQTNVTDQFDKQTASLNARYEILTTKFIAYDALISRLESSFSSLELMIAAEYSSE